MPTIADQIASLSSAHDIIGTIDCDYDDLEWAKIDLYDRFKALHSDRYEDNQRILITLKKDFYSPLQSHGSLIKVIQIMLHEIDISNFFICLLSTNPDIISEYATVHASTSIDTVPVNVFVCDGSFDRISLQNESFTGKMQMYNSQSLAIADKKRVFQDKIFCMMPWVGVYISPDNRVSPCCEFDRNSFLGKINEQDLTAIYNSEQWKRLRNDMFNGRAPPACHTCYHKESLGRDSLRNSINRDFAHRMPMVHASVANDFHMPLDIGYFDIRYNNLCNLTCRSCSPILSSSWAQLNLKASRSPSSALLTIDNSITKLDDQILSMLPHVEKIYFAGGEPTMIEIFYKILQELIRLDQTQVHLVYNTNLTRLSLKQWDILDLWKKFSRISVLGSLDGMDRRGEYLRAGSNWSIIEANVRKLKTECPKIDFYVSCTTGLINALHVPDFHMDWVSKGLIQPQDFNLQILYVPEWMSLKHAPDKLKKKVINRYLQHLEWLEPRDQLGRASSGFRSVISFAQEDGVYNRDNFWQQVQRLDRMFDTDLYGCFPELQESDL